MKAGAVGIEEAQGSARVLCFFPLKALAYFADWHSKEFCIEASSVQAGAQRVPISAALRQPSTSALGVLVLDGEQKGVLPSAAALLPPWLRAEQTFPGVDVSNGALLTQRELLFDTIMG